MVESQRTRSLARLRKLVAMMSVAGALVLPSVAFAQSPNKGALTIVGGVDAPSVYVLRGLVQESDPSLTLTPWADLGITLKQRDGVRRLGVNVGVWNSLNTGDAGTKGFTEHLHYAETVYGSLGIGLGRHTLVAATYTAYTSPNLMFNTVKEVSVTAAYANRIQPYTRVAFEVGEWGMDGGTNKGTYVELGAAPSVLSKTRLSLAVPVKLGLSAKDYYELDGTDHPFGFLSVGGLLTMRLTGPASSFGAWSLRGGVDYLTFGDTTKAVNAGEGHKLVGLVGIGFAY